jgi:hypothetical protein
MRSKRQLEKWLAREVLGKQIPRKPPSKERRGPARDADYRAWIRTFPCAACGVERGVECAHVGDDGGMSMKCSDFATIPLCAACHRTGPHAYHRLGRTAFARWWKLDIPALVARLNAAWRAGAA